METRIASPRQQLNEWRRLRAWTLHQAGWTGSAIAQALGVTPILRAPLTRDHWSVIGGLTAEERLLLQMQEQAFRGPAVVRFLQHLLRQIPGQLLVSWDGAPIHRAQVVTEFLAAGAAERLHLEPLPGYAPALNPAEGVGNHLKPVELRNVCCDELPELRLELGLAITRLRRKRHVLHGCMAECGSGAPGGPHVDSILAANCRNGLTECPDAA